MQKCTILTVGRLKISFWAEAAGYYRKKLRHSWKITEIQVKDGASANPEERREQEAARLLAALPTGHAAICLDERGDLLTSKDLATLLQKYALENRPPCFIVGGAYGLAPAIRQAAAKTISLSPLTFTHELAQVLLWEQLYRADSIIRGAGYHHE